MKALVKTVLVLSGILLVGCGGGGGGTADSPVDPIVKSQEAKLDTQNSKDFVEYALLDFGEQSLVWAYNDGEITDGASKDGTLTIKSDTKAKTLTLTFKKFVLEDGLESATFDGSTVITMNSENDMVKSVKNLLISNNKTTQTVKYENFVTLYQNGQPISYGGKIDDSDYGYVAVSTTQNLGYGSNGDRLPQGTILIVGLDSDITVKYAYDERIRVETRTSQANTLAIYKMDEDEVSLQELPNAAPVVTVVLPTSIYTDTDLSELNVTAYDPDLDSFTLAYEWKVNGEVKSTTSKLDNTLFKKGDSLTQKVTAADDSHPENSVTKTQTVLNSPPVISGSFSHLSLELGEKKTLDYTVTDPDNDPVTITWKHYDYNNCLSEIEFYDLTHEIPFAQLGVDEQNTLKVQLCTFHGDLSPIVFITDSQFYALSYGSYLHELSVSDGSSIVKKAFDSHITKMDLIASSTNNSGEKILFDSPNNMFMKDFNNDGDQDLIYVRSVDGVKMLTIEYRIGEAILDKKSYEISSPFSNIFVADYNGDGKLDILFSTTNGYSPPTNKTFRVMLQQPDGTLGAVKSFDLANYLSDSSLLIDDMDGDGYADIALASDGYTDTSMPSDEITLKLFMKDQNVSIPVNVLSTLEHYLLDKKILSRDLDHDGKKDIIVINKNPTDSNGELTLDASVFLQDNGGFREIIYRVTLNQGLQEHEIIIDLVIADMMGREDVWIVATTKNIYMLALEGESLTKLSSVAYSSSHAHSATLITPTDINHDDKKDLILIDKMDFSVKIVNIFIQSDNQTFFPEQGYTFHNKDNYFRPGHVFGDLDGDGSYEIFFNTSDAELSSIYFK